MCLLAFRSDTKSDETAPLNQQVHEGQECARYPLECPQKCGKQRIPREEVRK